MNHLARLTTVRMGVLLSCVGFVLQGAVFLPLVGIQADEALIANPIFGSIANAFWIRLFHHNIPIMLMDYVGALKAWLYWPIFAIFRPSPASLRWPLLILGAITIWLFYLLLSRIAGARAALAGCALLATDTTFLLTTEIDWGPVAIQHLLMVIACLLLLCGSHFGGFLALGLGLWDKASFGWILGGFAVAALTVFPQEILRRLNRRNIAAALAGILLGASSLLIFNARNHWPTHAAFSTENIAQKADVLKGTLDGSGLFGYLAPGPEHSNLLLPAVLIALVIAPLWGKSRRAILFALVFMGTSWILMALTANAGGSVHHAVLLWPFPQFVIAVALAEASQRFGRTGAAAFVALIAILCSANLLLTYQYHASLVRNGPMRTFTDAIFPLSDSLFGETREIVVMDWDIYDPLLLLNRGQIKLRAGFFDILNGPAEERIGALLKKDAVFVTHSPELQFFPAVNQRLENEAIEHGWRKELLRNISDRHGRSLFEVYRFVH